MKLGTRRRLKGYFYSILTNIIIFFIGFIFVLSLFLYINYKSFGLDIVYKSNQKLLTQIGCNINCIDKSARTYGSSLFSHPNVTQLMYSNSMPITDTLNNISLVDNSLRSIPFIYSVYIYNGKMDRFYSIGAYPDIQDKDFYDKGFVDMIKNARKQNIVVPIARRVPVTGITDDEKFDVYTYLFYETNSDNITVKNAMAINVNTEWVFSTYISTNQLDSMKNGNIMLIDSTGKILGHSQKEFFLKNISKESYAEKILNSKEKSGYFVGNVNGVKSVVIYATVENLNWKIVSIIPYNYIAKSIDHVKYIVALICFLVLLLGIILSYVLSRRIYSPINAMKHRIDQMLGKSGVRHEAQNEFDFITSNFSTAVDKLSILQTFKNRNINLLKQEYLKDILFNKIQDDEKQCLKFEELGISLHVEDKLKVIIFKLDNYLEFCSKYSEADQELLRFALANIMGEIIGNASFSCESVNNGNDQIICILGAKDSSGFDLNKLYECIKEIQSAYAEFFSETFSAFISGTCTDVSQIPEMFKDAEELSLYRLSYGQKCILSRKDINKSEAGRLDVNDINVSELLEALKSAKIQQAETCLAQIILKLYYCDYNNIMFTLSYLTSSVFNLLSVMERNSTIVFDIDYVDFNRKINQLETLGQIKLEYCNLFTGIVDKINRNRDDKYDIIVNNAIRYIHNNYTGQNLSLNSIAEALKISPSYLARLFKEAVAKTISDYLREIRLEKAKEYLKSTSLTIDEITDKIGWGNKKYFSTVFKQTQGVTPMEYRLKESTAKIKESQKI